VSRQAVILDLIQMSGYQSVGELAEQLDVDPSTIRRHLERLEKIELVQRTHGGAYPIPQAETPALFKQSLHRREKVAIGKAMADRVLDGQVIMLDGGSTTLEVARHLNRSRVTVVTNDLRIGLEIASKRGTNLVFIGGELLPDVSIFGADTVNESGIYNISSYEMESKRTMMSIASQAFFVADSSKFHREALFKVFDFESFTAGITDDFLDPIAASQLPIPIIRVSAK
jgi:DeoR/GlpR family transcriptional regulator of sugar metabolism